MAAADPSENGHHTPDTGRAAPLDVETLIDRWVQRLERFPEQDKGTAPARAGAPEPPPAEKPGTPTSPVQSDIGAPLVHQGNRVVHRGSIGLRGPCAPPAGLWLELQVPDPLRAAFDHVATWYGGAFDAVNVRRGVALSWGVWHLSGASLAQAIAAFRRRSPDRFEATLALRGIDAAGGEPPRLALRTARGTTLQGSTAEHAIGLDPRLVGALVQAAREPAARAAQIEAAFQCSIRPALSLPVGEGEGKTRPLGDVLQNPRHCAIALQAMLVGGTAAVRVLCKSVAAGAEAGIEAYLRTLERLGAANLLLGARRILATPELDIA